MTEEEDIQQQLSKLREEFGESLISRVNEVVSSLDTLQGFADTGSGFETVFRQIHTLAGSAGTFGFHRLSVQSRQLELIVKPILKSGEPPDLKFIDYLRSELQKLVVLAEQGPEESRQTPVRPVSNQAAERLLYLVEGGGRQEGLSQQLKHSGFRLVQFNDTESARAAAIRRPPKAMIIDMELPDEAAAAADLIAAAGKQLDAAAPLVFLTNMGGWQCRLAAVRAGGVAFIEKPLDVEELIDLLDRIIPREQREPNRVLVVDDAVELAQHYALVLRQAGMHSESLSDPSCILEKLESFKPELVLMDLYLPGASGMEVAQVMRQHQAYFGTPIVFLSIEWDQGIQIKALQQGDDFLEKPVLDEHLVSAVDSRIRRARALWRLMYHDSLTGLLNHITLKLRLEAELARSRRQGEPLCFVMLDIDHFKLVNDSFGHTAGDRVLKSLGRLLQQRLRKTDLIGRYGGEEFGVILPETDSDTALGIMQGIASRFAAMQYRKEDRNFSCTLSAGIASSQFFPQEKSLIEAADKALYQAKVRGRDRILIARDGAIVE